MSMTYLNPNTHGSRLYVDPPDVPEVENWCCMCEEEKEDATDDGEGICAECLQKIGEKEIEIDPLESYRRYNLNLHREDK